MSRIADGIEKPNLLATTGGPTSSITLSTLITHP